MKKIILTITALAVMAGSAYAQDNADDSREDLHFGIKAGVNYSNVYDSQGEDFDTDPKVGFAGGAFLAIPVGKFLGVQPEVLFSQKGFEARGNILGSPYRFTRTTNYLDIPVLFALKPHPVISILAGPQYSYLLSRNDIYENEVMTVEQVEEFENDNIRRNTLCFLGGLDINLDPLVLGARAGWDIQNNRGDGTSTTPRYKNVWYQATVGIRF